MFEALSFSVILIACVDIAVSLINCKEAFFWQFQTLFGTLVATRLATRENSERVP